MIRIHFHWRALNSMDLLIITVIIVDLMISVNAELHCFCNDPSCISTGYMCKSSMKCFSQLTYETDESRSAHGCLESLPINDQKLCDGNSDIIKAKSTPDEWPILMCCHSDMCNYMDSLKMNIYVNTKSNMSDIQLKEMYRNYEKLDHKPQHYAYATHDFNEQDLWFKAAVIAVPIAGGFILILLVLLAMRMLRDDNRRRFQFMHVGQDGGFTKHHLYVAEKLTEQNEDSAHLCNSECSKKNRIFTPEDTKQSKTIYFNEKPLFQPSHKNHNIYERMSDTSCNAEDSSSSVVVCDTWYKNNSLAIL